MTLIVEDGTGLATAESYLSVADWRTRAAAYGLAYLDPTQPSTWLANTDTTLTEAALRRATTYLSACYYDQWAGAPLVGTQALDFPRVNIFRAVAYGPPADASGLVYSATLNGLFGIIGSYSSRRLYVLPPAPLPEALLRALVEVAAREYVAPGSLLPDYDGAQPQTETVGPISTTYFDRPYITPVPQLPVIDGYLRALLLGSGSGVVGVLRA